MGPTDDRIVVLHVDDQPRETRLMEAALSDVTGEFEIHSANTVEAGLRRLRDPAIDVSCVVSDYEMPSSNGLQFLERVRTDQPDLPFVLFTGTGNEQIASEAISAGVTEYLQKGGIDAYELLANRIENVVAKYRAEQEVKRVYEALEAAREPIGLLDEAGQFTYLNEAYAELYGYEHGELRGAHWSRVYPAEEADRVDEEILPAVEDGNAWQGETVGLRKDGSTFLEDHLFARRDDGGLVCTVREKVE